MEQRARLLRIQNLAAQRVILNRPFHESRKVGQLRQFRERPANVEARESLPVSLARFDPFALLAFHPRQRFRHVQFRAIKFFLRQQHVTHVPGVL